MLTKELIAKVEHTVLKPDTKVIEVYDAIENAVRWGCRGVCIPPSYVAAAQEFLEENKLEFPIISVAGFPFGYQSDRVKWTEIKELHSMGVDEIDVVAPLYLVKTGDWDRVDFEIGMYKEAAYNTKVKVIIETSQLSPEEIKRYCEILNRHHIDYAKTSTGYVGGGASVDAVRILRQELDPNIKIKASGGIKTSADMQLLVEAGADTLGMSRVGTILEEEENEKQE